MKITLYLVFILLVVWIYRLRQKSLIVGDITNNAQIIPNKITQTQANNFIQNFLNSKWILQSSSADYKGLPSGNWKNTDQYNDNFINIVYRWFNTVTGETQKFDRSNPSLKPKV